MENRGGNHRAMPTFNDTFGLRDRLPSDKFGESRRQLHDDVFGRAAMDWPSHGFGERLGSMGRDFGANFDSLCRQFHDLRPRVPAREEFGSCDSLDEDSARSLILEDTRSKSRTFEVATCRHLANAGVVSSLTPSSECGCKIVHRRRHCSGHFITLIVTF